jgi:hypothetical protein
VLVVIALRAHAQTHLFAASALRLQSARPQAADFARPFDDPLPAKLTSAAGKELVELANCRDFLAVRTRIIGSRSDADYRVLRLQSAPCVAMALLQSAHGAARTALPRSFLDSSTTSVYPATLWPAISDDQRARLAAPDATLASASGRSRFRKIDHSALALQSSSVGLRLTLMARGDFDQDGWEDAAFLWESHAVGGSLADAKIVVLTRIGSERRFRELALEPLLSGTP